MTHPKYYIFGLMLLLTNVVSQDSIKKSIVEKILIDEIRTVVVRGIGINREDAIKDGLRSAVEQAIGVYLTSETIINNSMLLDDNILTHSRGYIENYTLITEKKVNGLIEVKISADVIVKELQSKLIEFNLLTYKKEIKGENIFAQALTKINESRTTIELLSNYFVTYPRNAFKLEIGEPEIKTDLSDKVQIKVPYQMFWNDSFINGLVEILEETALFIVDKSDKVDSEYLNKEKYRYIQIRNIKYFFTKEIFNELFNILNIIEYEHSSKNKYYCYFALVDANGNSISEEKEHYIESNIVEMTGAYYGQRSIRFGIDYTRSQGGNYWENQRKRNLIFTVDLNDLDKISQITGFVSRVR